MPRNFIASPYGMRDRPGGPTMHHGIDIPGELGQPVYAMLPGVVTHATDNGAPGFSGYGKTVVVRHDKPRVWTLYAHLDNIDVVPGQRVDRGTALGGIGNTRGRFDRKTGQSIPDYFKASVPHLHFEVRTRSLPAAYGAGNVDPEKWLAANAFPLPTTPWDEPIVARQRTAPSPAPQPQPRAWMPPAFARPPRTGSGGAAAAVLVLVLGGLLVTAATGARARVA